jgi:hypothetical protein
MQYKVIPVIDQQRIVSERMKRFWQVVPQLVLPPGTCRNSLGLGTIVEEGLVPREVQDRHSGTVPA